MTEIHPYVEQEGWECLIAAGMQVPAPPQFWIIEAIGRFYVKAAFEEDTVDKAPRPVLDPRWRIRRVIEAIKCCLAFARVLDADKNTSLEFAFRWTRLQGRVLRLGVPWRALDEASSQKDDLLFPTALLKIAAEQADILDAAQHALAPLFYLFRERVLPRESLEEEYRHFWGQSP
ncbi:hypothetical protein [Verrucomicrobium sp. 3C]|uniref:hypothetical protein n=1 Tax=Verrucomicrobium sp. 3C TaxID=1134055 RepID=UPI001E2EAB20|nr:hypothetical protein [Verrucomicrobium sp. 3C]